MSESERLDEALERVLADQSPRQVASNLTEDEQRMVQMAQLLRGSRAEGPSPEFVERLRGELSPSPGRVSRRTAVLSSLGTLAAGLAAGFELNRSTHATQPPSEAPLIGSNGRWMPVANLADLTDGTIKPFTAGAVQGFLIHHAGRIRALSRICTHMGCTLNFVQDEQGFVCPCHGAEFDMRGQARYGPNGYSQQLPSLPALHVRVNGDAVEVWSA